MAAFRATWLLSITIAIVMPVAASAQEDATDSQADLTKAPAAGESSEPSDSTGSRVTS